MMFSIAVKTNVRKQHMKRLRLPHEIRLKRRELRLPVRVGRMKPLHEAQLDLKQTLTPRMEQGTSTTVTLTLSPLTLKLKSGMEFTATFMYILTLHVLAVVCSLQRLSSERFCWCWCESASHSFFKENRAWNSKEEKQASWHCCAWNSDKNLLNICVCMSSLCLAKRKESDWILKPRNRSLHYRVFQRKWKRMNPWLIVAMYMKCHRLMSLFKQCQQSTPQMTTKKVCTQCSVALFGDVASFFQKTTNWTQVSTKVLRDVLKRRLPLKCLLALVQVS